MNATISNRPPNSRRTVVAAATSLVAAILLGGASGYFVRGALSSPVDTTRSASTGSLQVPLSPTAQPFYEQGGRPAIVYQDAVRARSIYVQGGRPQSVYDEIAQSTHQ